MSPEPSAKPTRTPSATVDAYQLKVTLVGSEPPIWRRFQVAADATLAKLHLTLQAVMGWSSYHLHEFRIGGTHFGEPSPEDWEPVTNEARVRLGEVLPGPRRTFRYEYDFGDSWEHRIVVEKIVPALPRTALPVCLAGENACPPEDCGGIYGYYNLLNAVADPKHPDHRDLAEWLGEFDPNLFDLEAVNRRLQPSPRRRPGRRGAPLAP